MKEKVSIVIPTYNHCDDLLKPCLNSIIEYTTLENVEVIVVANGCTDDTADFVKSLGEPFKLIWFDEAIGYTKATNEGIKQARGEFIILLNNDCVLLPQPKDQWVNQLEEPFQIDLKVGITGPMTKYEQPVGREFMIFFCCMIKQKMFKEIGLLDEIFSPGGGEDVDFCIKLQDAGYKMVRVPIGSPIQCADAMQISDFQLYHPGEGTMHDENAWKNDSLKIFIDKEKLKITSSVGKSPAEWEVIKRKNEQILIDRYGCRKDESDGITCVISTRNRYYTTLPLCLNSIINQTIPPNQILIYDDGDHKDLREDPVYKNIFSMFDQKGIEWSVIFGSGDGQVKNHQDSISRSKYPLIWRTDDDVISEPNVLEVLKKEMKEDVGAVSCMIINPKWKNEVSHLASSKMEDIFLGLNEQWFRPLFTVPKEVDHLYSSFLFRKSAATHGYCMQLSRVGHREETIFTYEMKMNGWKLILTPYTTMWHFESSTGGIRDNTRQEMFEHDEMIFKSKLFDWNIKCNKHFISVLNNGLGDHFAFLELIPELRKKYDKIILGVCYPEVFEDYPDINLASIAEMQNWVGDCSKYDLYKWMTDNNWNQSLTEAYKKMYNL